MGRFARARGPVLRHSVEVPSSPLGPPATGTVSAMGTPVGDEHVDGSRPVSAGRLAELLGDSLPLADTLSPASFELVGSVRRLVEAVVLTDLDPAELELVTARVDELTELLSREQKPEALLMVRHPDGRIESLLQAAAGRLNPQALPVEWVHRPTEPPPGTPPEPVEVTARCVYTAAHGGSPGRVHGGLVALTLDEVIGVALRSAGASGMTVRLEVSLSGPVPVGRPVHIGARYVRGEGRKVWGTGEVVVDGIEVARAEALYVMERR